MQEIHRKSSTYFEDSRFKVVQRPATTAKNQIIHRSNSKSLERQLHRSKKKQKFNVDSKNNKSLRDIQRQHLNNELLKEAKSKTKIQINTNSFNNNQTIYAVSNISDTKQYPEISQQNENLKRSVQRLEHGTNNNQIMKEILKQEIVTELKLYDPLFKRLEANLAESLILIGKINHYEYDELINRQDNSIGFLLYGKIKIFSKDYKYILNKGETYGEHQIFEKSLNIVLKARALDESCFLWLPKKYYNLLREESIKNGLKNEVNQLEVLLRLSYIKKKIKEHLKNIHV